ncbi:MAG TPA: hypothetical protein PKX87_06915, partial [Alphaproteobacteria bacterium]|nr:hypothetical protein [Alphaproteobacteria bacterium]
LVEADGLTGGTILEIVGMEGAELEGVAFPPAPGAGRFERRRQGRGKPRESRRGSGASGRGAKARDDRSFRPEGKGPGKKAKGAGKRGKR